MFYGEQIRVHKDYSYGVSTFKLQILKMFGLVWIDLDPVPPTSDVPLIEMRIKELREKYFCTVDDSELY